jgi:hypothetical protein
VGVVGAASSVTSIQVANLLKLFKIPQVRFVSYLLSLSFVVDSYCVSYGRVIAIMFGVDVMFQKYFVIENAGSHQIMS